MKSKVILICLLLCPSAHAFERKDLVGTWELVSYVLTEDGTEKPWCKSPFGTISYAANGYMAVGINCRKPENDQITPDPKDMVFYTGKFSVRSPNTVVHHVENSSEISRIGHDLERTLDIKGDLITLSGTGVKGPVRLVWKKRK